MKKFAARLRAALAATFVAAMVAGCGTMGFGPTSLDPIRLGNAIATDDVHYVRGAVEAKVVSVNQLIPASAYMEGTPLITIAARAGAVEVLRYLIAAGANVKTANRDGATALQLAAINGSAPMIDRLLKGGADVNAVGPAGETALMFVALEVAVGGSVRDFEDPLELCGVQSGREQFLD